MARSQDLAELEGAGRGATIATNPCVIGVCGPPCAGGRPAAMIAPDGVTPVVRCMKTTRPRLHPIAMEESDVADSLLVTGVFTPQGR